VRRQLPLTRYVDRSPVPLCRLLFSIRLLLFAVYRCTVPLPSIPSATGLPPLLGYFPISTAANQREVNRIRYQVSFYTNIRVLIESVNNVRRMETGRTVCGSSRSRASPISKLKSRAHSCLRPGSSFHQSAPTGYFYFAARAAERHCDPIRLAHLRRPVRFRGPPQTQR